MFCVVLCCIIWLACNKLVTDNHVMVCYTCRGSPLVCVLWFVT